MKNRVITISREFGSGGRTIGKKVAEKLGIPCYDRTLILKTAEIFIKLKSECSLVLLSRLIRSIS